MKSSVWFERWLFIVNINENTFSRSVKSCYSWLPKGSSNGIINDYLSGRIMMICAILTNGHWLSLLLQDIATSKEFWACLFILKLFIQKWFSKAAGRVTIVLDNASIHWTSEVKQSWSRHDMRILGLSHYSQEFTPIELVFGLIKSHIRKKREKCKIDYSKQSGLEAILSGQKFLQQHESIRCEKVDFCN